MNTEIISIEMAYLFIGEDIKNFKKHKLEEKYFQGIKYYETDNNKIIKNEKIYFCSCNESYCWHIFRVIFEDQGTKF